VILSAEDQAPSIDDTRALWVSDLWEKIGAERVGHIERYYPAAKKRTGLGSPPSDLRSPKMPGNHGKPPLPCQEFWTLTRLNTLHGSYSHLFQGPVIQFTGIAWLPAHIRE
jgi:hypothetical protein